jgi:hypothetical protein
MREDTHLFGRVSAAAAVAREPYPGRHPFVVAVSTSFAPYISLPLNPTLMVI